MHEARESKTRLVELRFGMPIGFAWNCENGLNRDTST